MMQQSIHQGATITGIVGGSGSGVYHHSCRLVNDGEIVVFINNVKRDIFRDSFERRSLSIAQDCHRFTPAQLE